MRVTKALASSVGRRYSLQVIGRHGHGRGQERRLKVECDQDAEEQRIDLEVDQKRQEDRHEDDDDFGPFQRPAQQEDDQLGQDQEHAAVTGPAPITNFHQTCSPPR
jgi:hypothetical protein